MFFQKISFFRGEIRINYTGVPIHKWFQKISQRRFSNADVFFGIDQQQIFTGQPGKIGGKIFYDCDGILIAGNEIKSLLYVSEGKKKERAELSS